MYLTLASRRAKEATVLYYRLRLASSIWTSLTVIFLQPLPMLDKI